MTIEPIRNDEDLQRAFRRLEKIFQAEEGTARGAGGSSGGVAHALQLRREPAR